MVDRRRHLEHQRRASRWPSSTAATTTTPRTSTRPTSSAPPTTTRRSSASTSPASPGGHGVDRTARAGKVNYGTGRHVEVTSRPTDDATGTVQVLEGEQLLGSATLRDGAATVHAGKTRSGRARHHLTVTYSGDDQVQGSSTEVIGHGRQGQADDDRDLVAPRRSTDGRPGPCSKRGARQGRVPGRRQGDRRPVVARRGASASRTVRRRSGCRPSGSRGRRPTRSPTSATTARGESGHQARDDHGRQVSTSCNHRRPGLASRAPMRISGSGECGRQLFTTGLREVRQVLMA